MMPEEVAAGMFRPRQTVGSVLCCMCGIPMEPNAANMCVKCLRSRVDITEGLQKHVTIIHCPECGTYLQPPKTWVKAELESKELLTFCIKRLKNMNKVRLVHAEFIWTEPHSKRIKVKLRIQKEALNGAILEQAYVVEYTQQEHMCESCSRVQANPDQWVASVQVRQHVPHRRTFFYLEQLILKHGAAERAINIKEMDQGIDFFFGNRSHAIKFVEFMGSVVPIRSRNDKQLVSHDLKSNNYNYKYTFSVEICPICREDLICLPPKVTNSLGNLGPLVLCMKVSDSILLLDPLTLRSAFMDVNQYWRSPFKPLLTSRQLVEYLVFNVEVEGPKVTVGKKDYSLAYAEVARISDVGRTFIVRTHLGHLLEPGHTALGFDLYGSNSNDPELDKYRGFVLPEAVLIKRSYEEERTKTRGRSRPWKLKNMKMEVDNSSKSRLDEEKKNTEYEDFLRDLEVDPELRFNISFYRNKERELSEMVSTDGEDDEPIELEDLLAELKLKDEDMAESST
uniref:60S ribosomal export protein NMD3 n=1 Tax=Anthurium amnicola TaxID=1678845 RepID=A0A1D1XGH5_9ARAE